MSERTQKAHLGLCRTAALLAACLTILAATSMAQTAPEDDPNDFPPPLKTLSKDERNALDKETDARKRLRISIGLMEKRLSAGERLASGSAYRAMFFELGVFQGLVEDSLRSLKRTNRGTGRDLDNFKRFEIAVRGFAPRVELLRRESPPRYEGYFRSLLDGLRDARTEAVKPLFSDSVLPEARRPE